MDDEEVLKLLQQAGEGTVIRYREMGGFYDTYLVVKKVQDGVVSGQMAGPIGINSISLEKLVKKQGLSIAEFKPVKSQ